MDAEDCNAVLNAETDMVNRKLLIVVPFVPSTLFASRESRYHPSYYWLKHQAKVCRRLFAAFHLQVG